MFNGSVIGFLGSDCELRYTANGMAMLSFNVAANYRAREDKEWVTKTEWVKVTAFGDRYTQLVDQLFKGTKVYVSGKMTCTPWTDKQGNPRSGMQITADTIEPASAPRAPSPEDQDLEDIVE